MDKSDKYIHNRNIEMNMFFARLKQLYTNRAIRKWKLKEDESKTFRLPFITDLNCRITSNVIQKLTSPTPPNVFGQNTTEYENYGQKYPLLPKNVSPIFRISNRLGALFNHRNHNEKLIKLPRFQEQRA